MRVALDTNVLAYAEGVNGEDMKRTALELVEKLPENAVLLPCRRWVSCLTCWCVRRASVGKSKESDFKLAGRLLFDRDVRRGNAPSS